MLKVRFEVYTTDTNYHYDSKTFSSLDEIFQWHKNKANGDYSRMHYYTNQPSSLSADDNGSFYSIKKYLIRLIENENGIIFSDGYFTNGQKHWSNEVREWICKCAEEIERPKFKFVD